MKPQIRKATPADEKKASSWHTWEKEISEFPWAYTDKESCLILEGAAIITTEDGRYPLQEGDFVVFPKGLHCTWQVTKNLRKKYKFG
jgi:uncharacterized cupin superfamily protein